VARFVRVKGRPGVADAAITVVDDAQRKGLGRLLLSRLIAAACERRIDRILGEVLATNNAALRLIKSVVPDAIEHPDGRVICMEMLIRKDATANEAIRAGDG